MPFKRVVLSIAVLSCLLILIASPAYSQGSNSGSVAGLVTDVSGGAVAGATITLTDKSTNTARTTTSNEAGRYLFAIVPPGSYEITANKTGFSLSKVSQINVVVGTPLSIDFKLEVGSMSQTVEVSTTGAELQTLNSTIGTSIVGETLLMLPNIGRETAALATLQPAVTPNGYTAGVVNDQNTYQLDGGSISDDMAGSNNIYTPSFANSNPVTTGGAATGVIPTPVESIEEFRVNTSNQTADFNGSAGSQVQMVTKRGTNQYHGALYEYYFNNVVGGANSWDNNRLKIPIPQAHRNRFGGAVGGPLTPSFWGGKTYIFVNYEGLRYPFSTTLDKLVPSATLRAGVILIQNGSNQPSAFNLNPYPVTVTDPFTHVTTTYAAGNASGSPMCGPVASPVPCDPRGIGINAYVSQIWNNMLPLPNDPFGAASNGAVGDGLNIQGYRSSVGLPVTSNFGVARLDHDFGKKWHFMGSYRYYHFSNETTNQVDSGGVLPGDKLGQYKSQILRPLVPFYYVGGLTTNFTPFLTNDFHYSYTRNFWLWNSALAPPQPFTGGLAALPAPLEIGGETSNSFIPYNVDTQDVRERYWDGQDNTVRDDMSLIHGNHLLQFGGMYQRIWDAHRRDDNGVSTFTDLTYVSGGSAALAMSLPVGSNWAPPTCSSATQTNCLPSNQLNGTWLPLYEEALGIINLPQIIASRSGPNLALNGNASTTSFPPVTSHSIVPTYNVYFSDSWHMKPSFTFSYGLAWTLEMPPYETTHLDTTLVDASGQQVSTANFLRNREQAALNGQVYLPEIGYELVSNTGSKYAYNPYYGGFSPHFAGAWRPSFTNGLLGRVLGGGHTVIRGGWSRIYGRLNGVDLVLVPLLGAGSLQPITCPGPGMDGTCHGSGNVDPTNAFRIGTDGPVAPLPAPSSTLSQPNFSGITSAKAGDTSELDPNFKPSRSDEFSLSVQREMSSKIILEVGYVGRILKNEYQAIDLSSVPFMTTLGGESFGTAFANLYTELCGPAPGGVCPKNSVSPVTTQPFFEDAFAMPANAPGAVLLNGNWVSSFCTTNGATSCTAAVVASQGSNIKNGLLYPMWSVLPMTFGNATPLNAKGIPLALSSVYSQNQLNSIFMETSMGWGNYNGAIVSLTARNWHGITARSNFTWSRSLGTGDTTQATSSTSVPNPFNLHFGYGPQSFDYRFLYNLSLLYQPPFFKGQHGLLGHVLGGWSLAPLFTANSGAPLLVRNNTANCQSAWGEVSCVTTLGTTGENAILMAPYNGGNSAHYGVNTANISSCSGSTVGNAGNGTGTGINLFADPCAVYNSFRYALPTDTNSGGGGVLRNLPGWDLDMTVTKDITFRERFGMMLIFQSTNVLNHVIMGVPNLSLGNPRTFGVITSSAAAYNPRQMEFGLRLHF
ncbi:MAG TPA: carboxypeptidase-like regulatory domain-containing protein [Candidatus Acidoferrum sp.]